MTDKQTIKKLKAENKKLKDQILDWKYELGYFCVGKATPKSVRKFVMKIIDQLYCEKKIDFKKNLKKELADLRITHKLSKYYANSKRLEAKMRF